MGIFGDGSADVDLTKAAAYSEQTPYDLWQAQEEIPILRGHCVEDLTAIPVAPWRRMGALGSFINLVGSGRSCGSYVCEIPPKGETQAQRCLFMSIFRTIGSSRAICSGPSLPLCLPLAPAAPLLGELCHPAATDAGCQAQCSFQR